jgi:SHS2 domain-containing protein
VNPKPSFSPVGASDPRSSHERIAHPSEVVIRLRASHLAGLFEEAGRALAELETEGSAGVEQSEWHEVEVSAGDREALLVDWLNELIYRAESEGWIPTEFAVDVATDTRVHALVRGPVAAISPHAVKAATHHRLSIRGSRGGIEAEVLFDV